MMENAKRPKYRWDTNRGISERVDDGTFKELGVMASAKLAKSLTNFLNTSAEIFKSDEQESKSGSLTFKELQRQQLHWLAHNFARQVYGVTENTITREMDASGPRHPELSYNSRMALLINDQTLSFNQSYALLGIMEELGELTHAYIKRLRGIREAVDSDLKEEMEDAVGDIVIFLVSFCNTKGIDIDLQSVVEKTWEKVGNRDWVAFPKNGVSE